jgi:hypothetical protein
MAESHTFKTQRGKRATIRNVTAPTADGYEADVDIEDGLQFHVSIPGRRLAQGISALFLVRDAILDSLVRAEFAPGVRHQITLAPYDPELGTME